MSSWKEFYNSVQDSSWPRCDQIEDFIKLPDAIQLEIVRDHLFDKKVDILANKIRHIDNTLPNFLGHIEEVKQIIGTDHCLMNSQDVIFLYSIIWSKRPKNVLEIGRFCGWSTVIIFGALEDSNHGHLYTVDINDATNPTIKDLIQSRTTFITAPSNKIPRLSELDNLQFEVVFIDGDHSQDSVLADLQNTYKITTSDAWILLHDADLAGVEAALKIFLSLVDNVTDCGVYGEKIRLLYKKDSK